jgi:hypothetical protein
MAASARSTIRPSSDLVWDGGLHATAFVDNGAPLVAGADVGWTPDVLMATALSASLMARILELAFAADIDVVAYVCEQRVLRSSPDESADIVLTPWISVRTAADEAALQSLASRAVGAMVGPAGMGHELIIEPRVTVVPPFRTPW